MRTDNTDSQNNAQAEIKNILITGATGFIGQRLVAYLQQQQTPEQPLNISILSRDLERAHALWGDSLSYCADIEQISSQKKIDAIINLAGEPIADSRWTDAKKEALVNSRVQLTQQLVALCERLHHTPSCLINASAIGYYGTDPDRTFHEESEPVDGFTHQLCDAWEKTALQAKDTGVRVVCMRLGIVLGHGGALKKMALPFKCFVGGPTGSGEQWMSWIHIEDVLCFIAQALTDQNLQGSFNLTAPHPVQNISFACELAGTLKRPCWLRMPAPAVKLLFGEMGEELLLSGQKVVPKKLLQHNFVFKYPQLDAALKNIYSKS